MASGTRANLDAATESANVYVRQSSETQVQNNVERQGLQRVPLADQLQTTCVQAEAGVRVSMFRPLFR